MDEKKFAVLIDADNISSNYVKIIMDEAAQEGVVTIKRIYGDWTSATLNPWKNVLLEYAITPMQQYAYTSGKNSTDSAMIIDAMDILYTGSVDGFCLISSDSDFTKLACRLRESGKVVVGMGKLQTPKPFVSACSKFKYLDVIAGDKAKKTSAAQPAKADNSGLTAEAEIKKSIRAIIDEFSDPSGWVLASVIGARMQNKYPDFDCKNYGCKKLIELLQKFGCETKLSPDKTTYLVR